MRMFDIYFLSILLLQKNMLQVKQGYIRTMVQFLALELTLSFSCHFTLPELNLYVAYLHEITGSTSTVASLIQ